MSAKIQNALRMVGRQFPSPRFTRPEERSPLTWARVIEDFENIPDPYREFVRQSLPEASPFPYTVLAPAYRTFRSQITEKLIFVLEREIRILEHNEKNVTSVCYPINAIQYVEVSSMLLDYRVRIEGVTDQGIPASSMVRSSAATDYVFAPLLKKIRLFASTNDISQARAVTAFDSWSLLNYKFMNFARNSLLGGERLICAILQPEIKAERFKILGKVYYQTISPTHTCILTDQELILIREEMLQGSRDTYGGIWNYIPLSKIENLSISRREGDLLALSIMLVTHRRFECLFDRSKAGEIHQLLSRFHELTSH